MTAPVKRFSRSRNNKWIGGVAGGIAEYFGWDVAYVRAGFVLSCLLPGPQFVVYIIMWIMMPKAEY